MDDLIHSCSTKSEANRRRVELDKILESGSFHVKEWYCTSGSTSSENEVNLDGEDELKTLGLGWNPTSDTLKFTVKPVNVEVFTTRLVLSKMSTLFDPLGLASPVTIKMRMAMQEIWRNRELDWDDKLTVEDRQMWSVLFEELFCLKTISFPRSMKPIDANGQNYMSSVMQVLEPMEQSST